MSEVAGIFQRDLKGQTVQDPRKQTFEPTGPAQDVVRDAIHAHLVTCTWQGAQALGCTGVSFVTMALGIWAAELAELQPEAAVQFLRALADMFDPGATPGERLQANLDRALYASELHRALDLSMTKSAGAA